MNPINRFLFHFDHHPIWVGHLRQGISILLAVAFVLILPDYLALYGSNQLADTRLVELKRDAWALKPEPAWVYPAAAAYFIACIGAYLGVWSRVALLVLLLLHHLLFTGHTLFAYGFDFLVASTLFYLALVSGSRATFMHSPVLRTIQLHLCIIYFVGGLNKTFGMEWWNGEALWKAVIQPGYPTLLSAHTLQHLPTAWWVVGGWAVILLELGYSVFIWFKPTRQLWLWATIALHVGIAMLMGLYFFSAVMILINLAAFHYPYLPSHNDYKPSIFPSLKPLRRPTNGSETPAASRLTAGTKR